MRGGAKRGKRGRGDEQDRGIVWICVFWRFIVGRGRSAWPSFGEETNHVKGSCVCVGEAPVAGALKSYMWCGRVTGCATYNRDKMSQRRAETRSLSSISHLN